MIRTRSVGLVGGLIALLLLTVVAMAPARATAQSPIPPPPLATPLPELHGLLDQATLDGPDPCIAWSGETSATYPFKVSGVSIGNYPGTFTATGSATTSTVDSAAVTDFHFTFQIDSPVGQVEGTATLNTTMDSQGFCGTAANDPRFDYYFQVSLSFFHYEATITTADGTFRDSGDGIATVYAYSGDENTCLGQANGLPGLGGTSCGVFDVDFTGSNGVTFVPVAPTDEEQCKNDGWMTFTNPSFRNQGDCIQYVNTGK